MRNKSWIAAGIVLGMISGSGAIARAQAVSAAAGAASTNTNGGPEGNSSIGNQANYSDLAAHQHGGMVFMGDVRVEGGVLPWDAIPVVVTCNGVVRYRTEADAKGHFTIEGSHTASELVATKASVNQVTASQLVGCDAEGDLPGFKSNSLYIMNGNILDNPNIGTIVLHPDSTAEGSSTSATTAAASQDAMKHFEKSRLEWLSHNGNGAEHDLEKAVKSDPNFAEAWYQLGKIQQAKGQQDAALRSYQKAVAADPKFVSPYEPIAEESAMQKRWQDVVNATSAALKLDPAGTPQLWYFDAVGNYNLGKVDEAETSARKSLAIDPQHVAPNTEQLLAVMLAGQGQLEEALHHLQNSLTYIKSGPNVDVIKQQIAQLERALPQESSK